MNASTNLVGFTFIVLTSLKAFHVGQSKFVEEFVALAVVGFMFSTLFSFLSIRSTSKDRSRWFEKIADYMFFASLFMIFIVCILLAIYD